MPLAPARTALRTLAARFALLLAPLLPTLLGLPALVPTRLLVVVLPGLLALRLWGLLAVLLPRLLTLVPPGLLGLGLTGLPTPIPRWRPVLLPRGLLSLVLAWLVAPLPARLLVVLSLGLPVRLATGIRGRVLPARVSVLRILRFVLVSLSSVPVVGRRLVRRVVLRIVHHTSNFLPISLKSDGRSFLPGTIEALATRDECGVLSNRCRARVRIWNL